MMPEANDKNSDQAMQAAAEQKPAAVEPVVITQGRYIASAVRKDQYPERELPEIVFIGRSNVGKSSLINKLQSDIEMETGEISRKIARGKNTTRHAQLIRIEEDTFICDTPGFSSMLLPEMEKESLDDCFPEFLPYIADCKFAECAHINEPSCAVKAALEEGKIAKSRYNNYVILYDELKNRKRW